MRTNTGSTSNELTATSLPTTGLPQTWACWGYANDAANGHTLMCYDPASGNNSRLRLTLQGNVSGDPLRVDVFDDTAGASTNQWTNDAGTYSSGTIHHCAAVFTSSDATAYLDGTAGSDTISEAVSVDSANLSRYRIAGPFRLSSGTFQALDGGVAWPCIWDVALSQEEIDALAAGAHPYSVRPGNIVWFGGDLHTTVGEVDLIGSIDMTETGTVGAEESPLLAHPWMLHHSQIAAGGVSVAPRMTLMGVG